MYTEYMTDNDRFNNVIYSSKEQDDQLTASLKELTSGNPGLLLILEPSEIADFKFRFELIDMSEEFIEVVLEKALLAYRQATGKI